MTEYKNFDVVIIGGSYAGLSAAMTLGRAMQNVLIIDSGKPCNRQTPHAHNLITHDGRSPGEISAEARKQVMAYPTVIWLDDLATSVTGTDNHFIVTTAQERQFAAKKLLFATGVKDLMPPIPGLAESWGISVVHCPYCHGYEYRGQETGILINGDMALDFGKFIRNWTNHLTIFTNGPATFDSAVRGKILSLDISINEKKLREIQHDNGYLKAIVFEDQSQQELTALYARPPFEQHCPIPQNLGCNISEQGYIQVDEAQKTNVAGIYAAGDNTSMFRGLSMAMAAGTMAGARMNHELINERHS
ncbi:NAD(P)/FAD-dependent oxidoreductase [Dyadobacter pollutisoli]|uniref:NAD(P)/FAD-dependent oxidoreductase n=1 Tax=Dyadobacter pollutisoli TaxID=2910158 RepID=A0A9E8ND83_9BACT|nr:NAD(P)/FAD-dependent oxidoreductase [Dyadobacter pollutisoli]WAC14525.1 NAD(P)/FAD-dependent oxidoreductase [Dyadobacter pollutisoli]